MAWKPAASIIPDDVWLNLAVPKSWAAPFSEFVIMTGFGDIWVPPEIAKDVVYDETGIVVREKSQKVEKWIQDRVDDLCVSINRRGPLNHGPEMPESSKRVFHSWMYEGKTA